MLAIVSALAWIGGVAVITTQSRTEPVGAADDTYNRLLTAALVLLVAVALGLQARIGGLPAILLVTWHGRSEA